MAKASSSKKLPRTSRGEQAPSARDSRELFPRSGGSARAFDVALGFSLHTGWAAAVAVTGDVDGIDVILRRRLELLPSAASLPRFMYHRAAELDLAEAEELIQSAQAAARASARKALEEALHAISAGGWKVRAAGIPTGSTAVPSELPQILAAHTLIHAAEGKLFQKALAEACEACGLCHFSIRQRDLWTKTAEASGMEEKQLRASIDGLRKTAGPPWSADQKIAAAAALFALHTDHRLKPASQGGR